MHKDKRLFLLFLLSFAGLLLCPAVSAEYENSYIADDIELKALTGKYDTVQSHAQNTPADQTTIAPPTQPKTETDAPIKSNTEVNDQSNTQANPQTNIAVKTVNKEAGATKPSINGPSR